MAMANVSTNLKVIQGLIAAAVVTVIVGGVSVSAEAKIASMATVNQQNLSNEQAPQNGSAQNGSEQAPSQQPAQTQKTCAERFTEVVQIAITYGYMDGASAAFEAGLSTSAYIDEAIGAIEGNLENLAGEKAKILNYGDAQISAFQSDCIK
jgi:hypothetical protein